MLCYLKKNCSCANNSTCANFCAAKILKPQLTILFMNMPFVLMIIFSAWLTVDFTYKIRNTNDQN